MPIVVNLDVMLAKKKMTLTELAKKLDHTVSNASVFNTGRIKSIKLANLDIICRELECKPGDILDYVDHKTYKKLYGRVWALS